MKPSPSRRFPSGMCMNFVKRTDTLMSRLKCDLIAGVSCLLFGCVVLQSPAVFGFQDNPFATNGAASAEPDSGIPANTDAVSDGLADIANEVFSVTDENARSDIGLVVRSVRMSDPQTPNELLSAVETLLDVEAIGDARLYLDRITKQNLKPEQLFDLFQLRGTEFFYQLHATDELAPAAQEFAKLVLATAKNYSSSTQRLGDLVKQLSNADINVRSNALAQLKRIGSPAYAAMLEVFADENRKSEFNGVRGALQRLGDDATELLVAASRSGNAQIEAESYVALTKLRSEEALNVVGYLYLSPKTSASVKQLAGRALQRAYGTIDRQRLYCDIADGAQASLKVIETSFDSQAKVNDWTYDREQKKFIQSRIAPSLAAKRLAAIQAELLYNIQPNTTFNRQLFMLTQLESAKRTAGPDGIVDSKSLLKKFGNPPADELNRLLKKSMKLKLMPAAIAICELLREQADPAALQAQRRSPLIEAILHGDRYLQFAAFEAIIAIDPKSAYPGSSHVMDVAAFFARTKGVGKVLVGHLLGPSSRSFSSVVSSSGLKVLSARNGHQFYNAAIESPDFEVFILTPSLAKPAARELVQLLRSDWRTRQVPVGYVGTGSADLSNIAMLAQSDSLLRPFELSFDSRVVASQIDQIQSLSSSWPVSASSRLLHGQVAANWMLQMIDQQDTHSFYQIRRYEDSILQLLDVAGYTEKACQMIAKLGTANSQEALVKFASQTGYSIEQRAVATKCFADSVERFGTLLTTDQIQQQYDRYNASESDTAEVQKLMGQLLDAIEKSSLENKKKSS